MSHFRIIGKLTRQIRIVHPAAALLAATAFVTACGGGGGGSTSGRDPSGSDGSGSSVAQTVAQLTASSTTVSVTASPTQQAPSAGLNLTVTNAAKAGTLYYTTRYLRSAVNEASVSWESDTVNGTLTGALNLTFYLPELIGSGTYHDTVTVQVCSDSACKTPLSGSPLAIAVTYMVSGNVISVASYAVSPGAINVESPSNASAATASINIIAYELPPYGAYVVSKSQSSAVESMTFAQTAPTQANGYALGAVAVDFKTPAALGPGIYKDLVTLSICYDKACTKPAAGSPWLIPVTYMVTASVGREFQQRTLNLNFSTLAGDKAGAYLYGVVAVTSTTAAQLDQVDPASGAITNSVAVPGNPDQIVVSDDGRFVYLVNSFSLPATGAPPGVTRVNLDAMTIDFTVSPTVRDGQMNLAVSPQNSRTWALGFYDQTAPLQLPLGYSVEIFDDGIARPDTWLDSEDSIVARLQWSPDASTVYILAIDDSGPLLQTVPVTQTGLGAGLALLAPLNTVQAGFNTGAMQQVGGLLYSDGGGVFDPTTNTDVGQYVFGSPLGFGGSSAFLSVDAANGRTFAAYDEYSDTTGAPIPTLQSFDLSGFSSIWIARLPIESRPVRWGANGLAFIGPSPTDASSGAVYLISGSFVVPDTGASTNTIKLH